MTSSRSAWTAGALATLLVAACGNGPVNPPPAADADTVQEQAVSHPNPDTSKEEIFETGIPSEMIGTWILVAGDGVPVSDVGKTPTLEILEDGSVAGVGGINRFRTQLKFVDGRLSFGPAAATKMAGPREAMELESTYLTRLGAVSAYAIEGDTLRLWAGDNEALTFDRLDIEP